MKNKYLPARVSRVWRLCPIFRAQPGACPPEAQNRTLRRRAGALAENARIGKNGSGESRLRQTWEHAETGKIEGFWTPRRESEKAGQSRGVVRAPRRSHLPAVRAVSGIYEGVPNTAKNSRRALRNEKKPAVSRETEGFQRKTRGEYRKMVKGKEKFALWITPECKRLVDDCYADDQCQSRSEYIEKAILFYTGFLYAEKADRYLPKVLQQILSGTLDRFAERIGRQLFKLAVEQNVNNHILASDTDIDARSYQKMRGLSMDEVKRTNGRIDFEDALLSERGV